MPGEILDLFERDVMEEAIEKLHSETAFYTASPVVEQLLDLVGWPGAGDKKLVDNSCGAGAFLGAALRRLLAAHPNIDDETLATRVCGWEVHFFAAAEARLHLERILMDHGGRAPAQARFLATRMVVHGDFLREGPRSPTWDVCVANPPFLRYAGLMPVLREAYENALPDFAQGDLLHSFLHMVERTLKPGGQIGIVTSDRWLFSQSAARLREAIGDSLGIAHLGLDCDSSFYRPKNRRAGQPPRIHPVALLIRDKADCSLPLTRLPIYPESDDTAAAAAGCRTLGTVASVRLAPWLGPHGIFVVSAGVAAGLPREHLVPAIDTDNIKGGRYSPPTKFAIRTQRGIEPCRAVMEHLDAQLHRMPKSKQRTTQRWLPPETFEKLDLSRPSLLVPRIASVLKPVRVPPGVLPLDHGISIVSAAEATLDEIEDALLRPEAQAWVRSRAPRLENGFHSLTTTLLRALPVAL